jgi:hypothetical protein
MNGLVKVPPYSKLNFQGKIFFTQNWCNITLNFIQPKTYNTADQSRFLCNCHTSMNASQYNVWLKYIVWSEVTNSNNRLCGHFSDSFLIWRYQVYTEQASFTRIYIFHWVSEWLLFNGKWAILHLYHGQNKLDSMKWWWCPIFIKHVPPLGHIILIPSQPFFALSP